MVFEALSIESTKIASKKSMGIAKPSRRAASTVNNDAVTEQATKQVWSFTFVFVAAHTSQSNKLVLFLHVQLYFKLFVSGASSSNDWAALKTSGDPLWTVLSKPTTWQTYVSALKIQNQDGSFRAKISSVKSSTINDLK